MDNLTHSLVALTMARSVFRKTGPGTTAVLLLSSNAPDVDIVAAFTGGSAYLEAHRGPTHGPLGVLGLGIFCGLLVAAFSRPFRSEPRGTSQDQRNWFRLTGLGVCGALLHVLMDLPTSYGTRLLSPFLTTWFAFDWLPIIDIYVWVALIAGLMAMARHPDARLRIFGVVAAILISHVSLRATAHSLALKRAGEVSRGLIALDRWSGLPDAGKLAPCLANPSPGMSIERRCRAVAVPRFLSPFQWRIIRHRPDGYELIEIDLLQKAGRERSVRAPAGDAHWAGRALQARSSRVFMSFARLPRAIVHDDGGEITVQLQDLRFIRELPASPREGDLRIGGLFRVIVRLDRQGTIIAERLED